MRRKIARSFVPPRMGDTKLTVPPPPAGEAGGQHGVSIRYSPRIAHTQHWARMARTTYAERMKENATYYPFVGANSTEYSIQYLPTPYKDPLKDRPFHEVGESAPRLPVRVPVIFLRTVTNAKSGHVLGNRFETVYMNSNTVREELLPQRLAVIATTEAYELLGLPVIDHKIHNTIPRNSDDYKKLMERRVWDEERWKFTVDYLFRSYERGPTEFLDVEEEWDGNEEVAGAAAGGSAAAAGRSGPIKARKARKIKLF